MKTLILTAGLTTVLWGCGPSAEDKKRMMKARSFEDSLTEPITFSANQLVDGQKEVTPFITIVSIKGMTTDASLTTQQLEQFVKLQGGYVEQSKLSSEITGESETQFSSDSAVRIQHYNVVSNLCLRVPYTKPIQVLENFSIGK